MRRTGIEDRKLDSHLKFCAETHDAALKHVERVSAIKPTAELLECAQARGRPQTARRLGVL